MPRGGGWPASGGKTSEELREILRTLTAKNTKEKEQKQTHNQQSLKGTLAEVLEKNKQETSNNTRPEPSPEKKPFEVSQDALQKVLKGEVQ